ncbi:MAG: KH domain-containing protein [Defluviitaleaceae bacterium]|nr:KH domain-containing protein [Defluviitaleaceae bacterium]
MKELLEVIIRNLASDQDEIKISQEEDNNNIILKLQVSKNDIGKIIGKNGKIIRSIRTIIKAGAFDTRKRVTVEILE